MPGCRVNARCISTADGGSETRGLLPQAAVKRRGISYVCAPAALKRRCTFRACAQSASGPKWRGRGPSMGNEQDPETVRRGEGDGARGCTAYVFLPRIETVCFVRFGFYRLANMPALDSSKMRCEVNASNAPAPVREANCSESSSPNLSVILSAVTPETLTLFSPSV